MEWGVALTTIKFPLWTRNGIQKWDTKNKMSEKNVSAKNNNGNAFLSLTYFLFHGTEQFFSIYTKRVVNILDQEQKAKGTKRK